MRPAIALASSLAIMACLAAPAGAQAPPAPAPQQDSVTGSALDCEGGVCPGDVQSSLFQSYTADAHSDPDGTHPSGTMGSDSHVLGEYDTGHLTVTCLSVSGHTAIVGVTGTVHAVTLFWMDGFDLPAGGLMRITDGGGPASGLDTVESHVITDAEPPYLPIPGPTDCSSFPSGATPVHNVDGGDLVVTDAPARPATKGDCRAGGWARFGFKNQGQCIAFVVQEARSACLAERGRLGRPAFRQKYGTRVAHRHALRRCVTGHTGR